MAFVRVEQRNAHLAGTVRLDWVNGRDGKVARANLSAISNTFRGSGEQREEEATAIQWTAWGRQAENAAAFLGKGSHVNIVGHLRNNHYQDAEGADVYGLNFTVDEIDYLDSKVDAQPPIEGRVPGRSRRGGVRRPVNVAVNSGGHPHEDTRSVQPEGWG